MFVSFKSPRPSCKYVEYGKRFMLAPRSNNALSTENSPILHFIVGAPGSLYFIGYLFKIMELTCSVRNAFFGTFALCLAVTRSLMNLAYAGTCLIASRRGILI